jgi:hypothetical protein
MYWFAIGAVCGIIHVWIWLTVRKREVLKPIPVVLSSAVLGAAIYGSIFYSFLG